MRLHESGIRLNFNLIGDLTDLEYDVDCRIGVDLQDDSTLDVGPESGQLSLEHVRPQRQARQHVVAGFVADGSPFRAGCRLSYGDLDTWKNRARLILDGTTDLCGRALRRHHQY